jgi:hypothetical protein
LYTRPVAVANPNGAMSLFAVGDTGAMIHTWQSDVGGAWAPWTNMDTLEAGTTRPVPPGVGS